MRTTEAGGERRYDADKKITGCKLGLLLAVAITSAAIDDATSAPVGPPPGARQTVRWTQA